MRHTLLMGACLAVAAGCAPAEEPPPEVEPPPATGVYGEVAAASSGIPSVITLTSRSEGVVVPEGPTPLMDQLGLQFAPRFLISRSGRAVRFKNSESIAHNVHLLRSEDGTTVLDEDTPPNAEVEFVFPEDGGYDVTCETHPGMRGFIYVTPADFAGFADAEGAYHIPDVPAGEYELVVWSLDEAVRDRRTITVPDAGSVEVSLVPSR